MLLDIRVETLRNILSGVELERIVAALDTDQLISIIGEDRFISTFGEDRIISALGKDRIIAAYERLASARPDKSSLASRKSKPRAAGGANKRSKKKSSK